MPSKRTNDSVDRILEELNMEQAQAGLRDSVTDHQVDEILRSVGILSLPDEPLPEDKLSFPEGDALDDLLQKPVSQPAPAPAQPRPYTPVQQPDPQPVQPEARTTRPPEQPLPTVDKTGTQTFSGDTTGTGIIKGFLGKMAPGGDAESLDQGKNEFKRFFKTSVAVVPDENGRLHEPGKKKRSLFGLKHAEDTGAFEPINVTMGGGRAVGQEKPEEEYYPDAELEPTPAQPARSAKKHGFFGSLFDREEETEELMIPEERAEEPSPYRPGAAVPPQQPVQTPSAAAVPVQPEPPVPPAQEETSTQEVWRSKYTRPARRAAEESGHTVEIIQGTVGYAKNHPSAPSPSGMTGTIYRKKKNTVEFTPGQKIQKAPPPQPVPQRSGEPVGEPIETPRGQTSTGYTMQIGGLDAVPVDSTQDFMAAYNAVRPQRRPAPAPVQPAAPVQTPPAADAYDESAAVDEPSWAKHDGTGQWPVPRQWDDVDTLVNTLTGNIHLTPTAPEHSGYTQNSASGTAPSAPAHSGFTQRIDMPAAPAPGSPANAGSRAPAPAHTGFTQRLDPAPAQPAHSGYTQNLNQQASAAPDTASFVNGIAAAINTQQPAGDTRDYDSAAARLTDSLADDPAVTRTRARIPTAAEVKKAAARLTGRADDETEDNAASPFDTAEIPVPHSREYERAEDAPAIRALLAKKRARAGIACIVSGAMSLVMIVLALLPVLFLFTRFVQKRMLHNQLKNRKAVSRASGYVPETVRNLRTIRTLGKETYMETRYDGALGESYRAIEGTNFYDALYSPVILTVNAAVVGAVMLLSASGDPAVLTLFGMTAGTAVTVMNYISQIFSPLESLGMEIQTIQSAVAGVRRINDFLAQKRKIPPLPWWSCGMWTSAMRQGRTFCTT